MAAAIQYQGTVQFRRGTAAQWSVANTILAAGELGLEIDTSQFKIGDGTSPWSSLSYGGLQGPAGASADPLKNANISGGRVGVTPPSVYQILSINGGRP